MKVQIEFLKGKRVWAEVPIAPEVGDYIQTSGFTHRVSVRLFEYAGDDTKGQPIFNLVIGVE